MKKRKTVTKTAPAKKTSSRARKGVEKTKVNINMKGTESRTRVRMKPDDYLAKVKKAVAGESPEKKTPQVSVTYEITEGKYKGKTIIDNYYLTKAALWRLRNALEAMGVKIPSKAFDMDLKKLIGKEVAITVDDEEYDNKITSRVKDVFDAADLRELDTDDELDEDDDEEDDDEEDDDDDEDEEDDEDEDDEEDDDEETDDDEEEDDDLDDVDLDDDEDE